MSDWQPTEASTPVVERARSTDIDPQLLGSTIRRLRKQRGLSQGELAGDVTSAAYISRIEAGERSPSAAVLEHIADRLHTTSVALLVGSTDDNATWSREAVAVAEATSQWLREPTNAGAYAEVVDATARWEAARAGGGDRFNLESAAGLAKTAHNGQVDKQGREYFTAHLEPIANALMAFGPTAVMAGYLHDIIEDTDHTPASLSEAGVPGDVVDAVVAVTRVPGETYQELIERARAHPLGRLVKLADNALNIHSNPGLAERDPERARTMLEERYLPARDRLLEGLSGADLILRTIREDLKRFLAHQEPTWPRAPFFD